ncbi:hypothetical protein SCHPADRAFT_905446 [Schizopora paradoxa]|uniref:DUF7918 domain-containing protein n=1 Tax=Schizopora paradoxa TaxID=27342 RepID=A0A0H2RJA6_9AGAM|nr:hypothetical protein SCHPADRAFT_905446 [Schizopora paradoxa]
MPSNNNYTFKVFADGVALNEYEREVRDNVCSCWIASDAGKSFYIHWTGPVTDVGLKCTVSLDGTILRSQIVLPGRAIDSIIKGCMVGTSTLKLFAFSKVSLTDDEAIAAPDQNLSELGTIELCVTRVQLTKSEGRTSNAAPPKLNDAAIHERSKKMSMHRITFQGTEELTTPYEFYTARTLESVPHARFVFKYRPREFLRAQGIAPEDNALDRAPENVMDDQVLDVQDAEQEEQNRREILETQRQMQELQARLDRLQNGGGAVKREVKTELLASFVVDADGVIDLTAD